MINEFSKDETKEFIFSCFVRGGILASADELQRLVGSQTKE
jgi:hypothetical protein